MPHQLHLRALCWPLLAATVLITIRAEEAPDGRQCCAQARGAAVHGPQWTPTRAEFGIDIDQLLPNKESYQRAVFSSSLSAVVADGAVDVLTVPPRTAALRQTLAIADHGTAADIPFRWTEKRWEPGREVWRGGGGELRVEIEFIALDSPAAVSGRLTITNTDARLRAIDLSFAQAPRIAYPAEWNYGMQFQKALPAPVASIREETAIHENSSGALAVALTGATAQATAAGSALSTYVELAPAASRRLYFEIVAGRSATEVGNITRQLLLDPEEAIAASDRTQNAEMREIAARLPALEHGDAGVVRFYRHAAMQLLHSRWRLGSTFVLDPWYSTSGRDSGAMNAYAWDTAYSAVAMVLLDPGAIRSLIVTFPSIDLLNHYAIEPASGKGLGPFYAYNVYAYCWIVDQYVRYTGDSAVLGERVEGRTVLQWLMALARADEDDRDPDGNSLLDYGSDKNLLELKKTGSGPGYLNEVPSPNGERAYVNETVAALLDAFGNEEERSAAPEYRARATAVRSALNRVLWMDADGWYGTRQRDGRVVPIWSIQIYDLLRFDGLVPRDRAERLVRHLTPEEFLGPWGPRSLSKKDPLFDFNDHDWAGPMSYAGDAPQLVADLYSAGFAQSAKVVLNRILWWPQHMAHYAQGVANDDYSERVPEAARFGGRVAAGRTNIISSVVGVEAIVRGMFGVQPQFDGGVSFAANGSESDWPSSLSLNLRGKLWTVSQGKGELRLDDGDHLLACVEGHMPMVRVRTEKGVIHVRVRTRGQGPARLLLNAPRLGGTWVQRTGMIRVNGVRIKPQRREGWIEIELGDPSSSEQIVEVGAG